MKKVVSILVRNWFGMFYVDIECETMLIHAPLVPNLDCCCLASLFTKTNLSLTCLTVYIFYVHIFCISYFDCEGKDIYGVLPRRLLNLERIALR